MLPPFIIEQIRQRERERRNAPQPFLELPVPSPAPGYREPDHREEADRGVVIIDLRA